MLVLYVFGVTNTQVIVRFERAQLVGASDSGRCRLERHRFELRSTRDFLSVTFTLYAFEIALSLWLLFVYTGLWRMGSGIMRNENNKGYLFFTTKVPIFTLIYYYILIINNLYWVTNLTINNRMIGFY